MQQNIENDRNGKKRTVCSGEQYENTAMMVAMIYIKELKKGVRWVM